MLGIVPSVGSTMSFNLAYSGVAGSIWSWLIGGIFTQSIAFGIAEICSSMPTVGGEGTFTSFCRLLTQDRSVLCVRSSCARRMGAVLLMDHWVVKFVRLHNLQLFHELCSGVHDPYCS